MSSILPGLRAFGSEAKLVVLCIASMSAWTACQHRDSIMEAPPHLEQICGRWAIDPVRTTWAEAKQALKNGSLVPDSGHLEIDRNGRFAFEDLPDFSFDHIGYMTLHQSGSGRWWTDHDPMNQSAYLWLEFEQANGKPVENRHAVVTFMWANTEYLLHVTIRDPDSGDAMVMRRLREGGIESSSVGKGELIPKP